jgi:hypothetical protein
MLTHLRPHTHTRARARTHARTHTHTHALVHTRTRTHTHSHTLSHTHTHTHTHARAHTVGYKQGWNHVSYPAVASVMHLHLSFGQRDNPRVCALLALMHAVVTSCTSFFHLSAPIFPRTSMGRTTLCPRGHCLHMTPPRPLDAFPTAMLSTQSTQKPWPHMLRRMPVPFVLHHMHVSGVRTPAPTSCPRALRTFSASAKRLSFSLLP